MQIQSTTSNPKNNEFYVLFYNQPQDILKHLQEITDVDDYLSRIIEKIQTELTLGDYLLLPLVDSALGGFLVLCYSDGKQKTLLNLAGKIPGIISKSAKPSVIIDTTLLTERPDNFKKIILSSINDRSYQFNTFATDDQPEHIQINWRCSLDEQKTVDDELKRIEALNQGVNLAKDLGNMPANICTPSYLAEQATRMAETHADLTVEIIEEDEMKQLGMGALLAVAQGSRQAPKLIVIKYQPAQVNHAQPIVLVGKGVTFDAGGISLKPAAAMDLMKYDMGGGASVFGAIKAAAIAQLNVPIIGIIPAVENLPDGNAVKPGDVVRSLSGRTIEILNTDAEGRLILCDALSYAQQFKPQVVIDIATLTGACVIALGSPRAGLMGNDEVLIDALYQAGEKSADKAWHLPLDEEYAEMLKSPFADVANISSNKEAGAITAAAFLSLFTEEMRWCHLDIAGVAWKSGGADKGSTGRPVSLLFEFLCGQDA